ncbi:MAG: type II secretion system F family protein [Anaerolineales bacterium]|nr:type II secretion system F family protein [Anaerolineales bacterium]MCB0010303.1 type II secretion system F family protein [Anaerolineales bacterium]MCB0017267.1 type II secretion system F family protein [Anaerolineales bacterium]MCB0027107.1 type II secretion system F family protein [Anaerolineales bacterium]MCB8961043.1 type II secretion system F family protein [Ardenticatenales bacterium]
MNLILILGVGVAVLMVLGAGIALIGAGRGNVEERLDQFVGSAPTFEVDEAENVIAGPDLADRIDRSLAGRSSTDRIRDRILKADLKLRVSEYIVLQFVVMGVGGLVLWALVGSPWLIPVGVIIGAFIPRMVTNFLATRKLNNFDGQLSDTLNLWVNSLRSGYSVLQGMESIATEMPPPISREFERVVQEVRLGLSLDQALGNMLRRVPSEDLDLVVTAVNIQREVGGNLAEILDVISFTIRERVRIKREIRTLTAQVRGSAYIVTALPVALGFILYLINPSYVEELWAMEAPFIWPNVFPCGWLVLGIAVLMMIGGSMAIRKIVQIEV